MGNLPFFEYLLLITPNFSEYEHFFIDDLIATPQVGILERTTKVICLLCHKYYILGSMRKHVGKHVLRHICGEMDGKALEVCFFCITLPLGGLMHPQLGVEPCGFCGKEGCTTVLDQIENGPFNITSSCQYVYTSFNYKQAKIATKTSPCTNVPILCPFCVSLYRKGTIWKYNAVVHMATEHPDEVIPFDFLSQIHISFKEAELTGVNSEGMKLYRETHNVPDSDDIDIVLEATLGDKCARASSASSVGGPRKSSRYQ